MKTRIITRSHEVNQNGRYHTAGEWVIITCLPRGLFWLIGACHVICFPILSVYSSSR